MHGRGRSHRRGQATVEYALIIAVILGALVIAISQGSFATSIRAMFARLVTSLQTAITNHTAASATDLTKPPFPP